MTFSAGLYYFLQFELQANEHYTVIDEHYNKMSREENEKMLSHY